jgi:hypothetical protein
LFRVRIFRIVGVNIVRFDERLPTDRKQSGYNRLESRIVHVKFLVGEFIEAIAIGLKCIEMFGDVVPLGSFSFVNKLL